MKMKRKNGKEVLLCSEKVRKVAEIKLLSKVSSQVSS